MKIISKSKNFKIFMQYIIPSIIGMLIVGSYSIVDSVFIGQYGGKEGLAGIAVTWPLVMIFGALGDALGTGCAILISQSRGSGHIKSARSFLGNMLILQTIVSIGLMIPCLYWLSDILLLFGAEKELLPISIPYARILILGNIACMFTTGLCSVVRNDGRPTLAMVIISISLILNIILDYVFIFPLNMGLVGAAWATLVSQIISCIIYLIYFATKYTQLRYGFDMFKIKISNVKSIIISGIPSLGNELSIISMLFLHNYQSMKYGHIDGLAVYTFIGAIESLGSLFMSGLAMGVQPLVAFLYGAKKYIRQRLIGNMGYIFAFVSGIVLMLISIVGRNIFPSWFNLQGEVAELASHGLVISSSAFLLLGVIRVACFYYQSTGKIKEASILIYGDVFFALPLCLFVLPLWFGLDGVWMAMPVSRLILFGYVCWLWWGNRFFKR